ncbi:MAG: TraB/GumN family protein [Sphingobacteriales bacterium]|nr:TraB/GumN family protein [Sphingobacteriales bacterium]
MKKYFLAQAAFLQAFFCVGQQKNDNSLLWRIDSKNRDEPSYLFGTIHMPQKKFLVYSDSVYSAIQHTNTFYSEIDFLNQSFFSNPETIEFLEEKGRYVDSLQKTDAWKNLIRRVNKNYNINLDPEKPDEFVEYSQTLLSSYFDAEADVTVPDIMLAQHASSLGKKTGGLETYVLQFRMLYDILGARLSDTTMQLEDEGELLAQMKKFYLNENIDSIITVVENINPTYRKIVFDDRNKTMADSIEKHLAESPGFFAVGVGHLVGKAGVLEWLRKKGFTVSPVHSENKISMLIINDMMRIYKKKAATIEDGKIIQEGIKDVEVELPPPPKQDPPKVEMKEVKPDKKKTKTKEQQ